MDKGMYCLLLENSVTHTIKIGALGELDFVSGWYLYVGSALGSGGLSRVSRHIRLYHEQYRKPKWHIDYLLTEEKIFLREVICAKTGSDLECVLASTIGRDGIPAFGCSDCSCATHLFYRDEMPEEEILAAFEMIGLYGVVHKID